MVLILYYLIHLKHLYLIKYNHPIIILLIQSYNLLVLNIVIYTYYIGDGDSSVTKRLNEVLPYGSGFNIQKIECRNHLLRNYCTKLTALAKKTSYPITVRKHILGNILRFRSDITKAVQYRKSSDSTKAEKIAGKKRF